MERGWRRGNRTSGRGRGGKRERVRRGRAAQAKGRRPGRERRAGGTSAGLVQQRMERTLRAITLRDLLPPPGALRSFPSFGG